MTAPTPADVSQVRGTAVRLLRWLRSHGHTQAKTAAEVLKQTVNSGNPHPLGSAAHVVTRALCRAVVATFVLERRPMFQALAEVHGLRSKAGGLVAPLGQVDALLAKANGAAPQPSFSELGNDVIAAVEALARRLEKISGVDAPTTRARWKDFVGATAAALRAAGVPTSEVASLFTVGGDQEQAVERIRRQTTRRVARRTRDRQTE